MNPKCSFRHPPLDGLLGTQAATSIGSSIAPSQPAFSAAMPVPSPNVNIQAVPCIFFHKGFCLKGDKCAFLHGPSSMNNKPHAPMAFPIIESSPFKRTFGSIAKCTQEQKTSEVNIMKPAEVHDKVKPGEKTKPTIMEKETLIKKNEPPFDSLDAEISRYNPTAVPEVVNESSMSRSSPMLPPSHDDHSFQNGKDADESIRESSPGFDVIVEDEMDDDYYHNEEQYGSIGQEGRNHNTMNDFDVVHSANYSSRVEIDRERYHDPHDLDSYDHMQGPYAREQFRISSDRNLVGTAPVERTGYPKGSNPDKIYECDLRHRLSKRRRVNGLRSVVGQDYLRDSYIEEQSYRGSLRDSRHSSPHDNSVSTRLRGRIKLPQRSSPVHSSEVRSERGMNWGRSSPGKPSQGRLRDRIKGVVMRDDTGNEGRNFRGPFIRRDLMDDNNVDFDAPKSLAELKGGKKAENKDQLCSFGGGQRNPKVESCQQREGDTTFEGPKPLSVILKRKREAGAVKSSDNSGEDARKIESKESLGGSSGTSVTETRNSVQSTPAKETAEDYVCLDEEEFKSKEGEEVSVDEGMEDQEVEVCEDNLKEDDYYGHVDGGEYDDINEVKNAEPEEDEEDGEDDFAKKIGVVFT